MITIDEHYGAVARLDMNHGHPSRIPARAMDKEVGYLLMKLKLTNDTDRSRIPRTATIMSNGTKKHS